MVVFVLSVKSGAVVVSSIRSVWRCWSVGYIYVFREDGGQKSLILAVPKNRLSIKTKLDWVPEPTIQWCYDAWRIGRRSRACQQTVHFYGAG